MLLLMPCQQYQSTEGNILLIVRHFLAFWEYFFVCEVCKVQCLYAF